MDYHLKFGILLSLLAGISFCAHSSKLGSHKYITKAYFDKHDTIIDQSFQDFIANNLPHGSCEIIQPNHNYFPNLSLLGRKLTGEGSHRRLISSIKIKNHQEMSSLSCGAIIIERLPSGVFADPFELQHLTQRGVFGDASAFGDTDLELPTVKANRSVVEIHMNLSPKNNWELKIELPLHARYAPLGEVGGYKRIEFGSPDLFVRCNNERGPHNDSCIYSSINDDDFRASILWEVPSGIVEHTKVVSMLTFISAIVSAFSISIACIYYSNTTFKQS